METFKTIHSEDDMILNYSLIIDYYILYYIVLHVCNHNNKLTDTASTQTRQ